MVRTEGLKALGCGCKDSFLLWLSGIAQNYTIVYELETSSLRGEHPERFVSSRGLSKSQGFRVCGVWVGGVGFCAYGAHSANLCAGHQAQYRIFLHEDLCRSTNTHAWDQFLHTSRSMRTDTKATSYVFTVSMSVHTRVPVFMKKNLCNPSTPRQQGLEIPETGCQRMKQRSACWPPS